MREQSTQSSETTVIEGRSSITPKVFSWGRRGHIICQSGQHVFSVLVAVILAWFESPLIGPKEAQKIQQRDLPLGVAKAGIENIRKQLSVGSWARTSERDRTETGCTLPPPPHFLWEKNQNPPFMTDECCSTELRVTE